MSDRALELSKRVVELCDKEHLTTFQALRVVELEERDRKEKLTTIFEGVNLEFTKEEINKCKWYWSKGNSVAFIAKEMKRSPYETFLLTTHLIHVNEIKQRDTWIFKK